MTKVERLIKDIEVMTAFVVRHSGPVKSNVERIHFDLFTAQLARHVRREADDEALFDLVVTVLDWAMSAMNWRELKPPVRQVLVATERLERNLEFFCKHRTAIGAALARGFEPGRDRDGLRNPQV